MKKSLAILVALLSSISSFAAGPADGIYACAVNVLGTISQVYVSINGHPDGATVFTVAAISPATSFYGYGIGTATATSFTGSTMFLQPFSFFPSPSYASFSGTIGIIVGNIAVNSPVSCGRIW